MKAVVVAVISAVTLIVGVVFGSNMLLAKISGLLTASMAVETAELVSILAAIAWYLFLGAPVIIFIVMAAVQIVFIVGSFDK